MHKRFTWKYRFRNKNVSKLPEVQLRRQCLNITLKWRLWMEHSNTEVKEQEKNIQIRSFTCVLFEGKTSPFPSSSTQCLINYRFSWSVFH